MDIKKLGLASTVAVLSVTVALGDCYFLKSQAEIEGDKAQATLSKSRDEWNKAFKEKTNTVEYKQALSKAKEAEREFVYKYAEYEKAIAALRNIPKPKSDKDDAEYKKAQAEYL